MTASPYPDVPPVNGPKDPRPRLRHPGLASIHDVTADPSATAPVALADRPRASAGALAAADPDRPDRSYPGARPSRP